MFLGSSSARIAASALLFSLQIGLARAEAPSLGMITDLEGDVFLRYQDTKTPLQPGDALIEGDTVVLSDGARAVIVFFEECREWTLPPKDEIKIDRKGPLSKGAGYLKSDRQLPVCYRPDDFKGLDDQVIGGYVMRGSSGDGGQAVENLRKEVAAGRATGSLLMTLIMHDLKNNKIDQARLYYDRLRSLYPGSEFVKSLARRFESSKN